MSGQVGERVSGRVGMGASGWVGALAGRRRAGRSRGRVHRRVNEEIRMVQLYLCVSDKESAVSSVASSDCLPH